MHSYNSIYIFSDIYKMNKMKSTNKNTGYWFVINYLNEEKILKLMAEAKKKKGGK